MFLLLINNRPLGQGNGDTLYLFNTTKDAMRCMDVCYGLSMFKRKGCKIIRSKYFKN